MESSKGAHHGYVWGQLWGELDLKEIEKFVPLSELQMIDNYFFERIHPW